MGKPDLTTNQRVVVWARGKLGQKIGRGECWDLGEQSLKQAGAQTSNDLGPVEDDSDYVWGEKVDISQVEPGDILQIRDHVVTTETVTEYTFNDGTKETDTDTSTVERPHHTAVVNGKLDANGAVNTLEQNVGGTTVVRNMQINTRDVAPQQPTRTTERHMNPKTKKVEMAKVVKKVTITVTGKIWAYKPKPK